MALEYMSRYGGTVGLGSASAEVAENVNYSWGHDPNGMLMSVSVSPPLNQ
jgi:hypothetical protein